MEEVLKLLKPLYLNSKSYVSRDWRLRKDCSEEYPIQRRLCDKEIVADFDGLKFEDFSIIQDWFIEHQFKFALYNSGAGVHIHFFTPVTSKYQKVQILKDIEKKIGYKIDTNPTKSNHIRAEDSFHPTKGYQKKLIYSNLSVFFYINELSIDYLRNLSKYEPREALNKPEIGTRQCMKYILNNSFANGRKRLMFCVVSHYKSQGMKDEDIFTLTKDWCNKQPNFWINNTSIWGSIGTSTGLVKCSYRHELLTELGCPIMCGSPLVQEGSIEKIDL